MNPRRARFGQRAESLRAAVRRDNRRRSTIRDASESVAAPRDPRPRVTLRARQSPDAARGRVVLRRTTGATLECNRVPSRLRRDRAVTPRRAPSRDRDARDETQAQARRQSSRSARRADARNVRNDRPSSRARKTLRLLPCRSGHFFEALPLEPNFITLISTRATGPWLWRCLDPLPPRVQLRRARAAAIRDRDRTGRASRDIRRSVGRV